MGFTFGAVRTLNHPGMGCTFGSNRNLRSTIYDGPKAQSHTSLRHRRRSACPATAQGPKARFIFHRSRFAIGLQSGAN